MKQLQAGQFRGESSLRTYVSTITRFTIIDWIRKQRQSDEYTRNLPSSLPDYYDAETAFEEARRRAILEHVWEHIDEKCRQIWTMIFFERVDYATVAERVGATAGTVKVWVFRCKEKAVQLAQKKGFQQEW